MEDAQYRLDEAKANVTKAKDERTFMENNIANAKSRLKELEAEIMNLNNQLREWESLYPDMVSIETHSQQQFSYVNGEIEEIKQRPISEKKCIELSQNLLHCIKEIRLGFQGCEFNWNVKSR